MSKDLKIKDRIAEISAGAADCVKNAYGRLGDCTFGVKGKLRLSLSEKGSEKASVDFVEDGKSFNVRGLLIAAGVIIAAGAVISFLDDIF